MVFFPPFQASSRRRSPRFAASSGVRDPSDRLRHRLPRSASGNGIRTLRRVISSSWFSTIEPHYLGSRYQEMIFEIITLYNPTHIQV